MISTPGTPQEKPIRTVKDKDKSYLLEIWDIVCDCQESPVISVFERPPPGHLVQNWYGIGKILANLQTLSTQFHSILPHRKTRKE